MSKRILIIDDSPIARMLLKRCIGERFEILDNRFKDRHNQSGDTATIEHRRDFMVVQRLLGLLIIKQEDLFFEAGSHREFLKNALFRLP